MNSELIALLITLLGLTETELAETPVEDIQARLVAAGEEIDLDNVTPEDVERLQQLATAAQQVRQVIADDEAAAEQRRTDAAAAAAALRGETGDPGEGPSEETPAEEVPAEVPAEEVPAEIPAPEAVPAEVPAEETPAEVTAPTAAQPLPVAAAAVRSTPVRRRQAAHAPRPNANQPSNLRRGSVTITAAADLPNRAAGARMSGFADIGQALADRWGTLEGANGVDGYVPVARIASVYPAERQLSLDDNPAVTDSKLDAVASIPAIVAAGGFCAPTTALYDLVTVSVADRPVRDSLPSFQANRGGIRYVPPPKLSDLASAVSTWTAATDANPGGSTKPCLTITCSSVTEVLLDAIPLCLQFGNFQARAFPEQVDRNMQLALAAQARYAERKIITAIGTGSTNVTTGQLLGTTANFLAEVDRVSTQYRNRHRMNDNVPLRVMVPEWLDDNIRADVARQLSMGTSTFAITDGDIDSWYRARNINVTRMLEGETGQDYGAQVAGGVLPWIKSVVWYLFHEGAWVFLDGGTLDIGLVRDSTLNAKNNFQMFSETFEQVAFRGVESLRISSALCPSGQRAATADSSALCTSGS